MTSVFVVPAVKGAIVRDPITKTPLPEKGAMVPYNTYWRRRITQGDVVLKEDTAAAPVASAENSPQTRQGQAGGKGGIK